MDKALIIAIVVLALSGCSTTHTGSLCSVGPFIPDRGVADRWTRSEKEQLVTLNKAGERICGWRAPN